MSSKLLNTDSCELTNEELETVAGGFPLLALIILAAAIVSAIKHH